MNLEKIELPKIETKMLSGIFVKAMDCQRPGTIVEQHVHVYDHGTFIARGSFRVFKNGIDMGTFRAPTSVIIEAGAKHYFVSMEPGSVALCIHDVSGAEVEIFPTESVLERHLA